MNSNMPIRALTERGYVLLAQMAQENPDLFLSAAPNLLEEELNKKNADNGGQGEKLFSEKRVWYPVHSLENLNAVAEAGPGPDATNARYLRESLPTLTRSDMSDHRVLTSINCFHLAKFSKVRWESSNLSDIPDKKVEFVKVHWLGTDKQGNTVARLWWLYEFAVCAAEHSKYEAEVLLEKMAGNVNFYHQLLRRRYLLASDRIRAMVLEVSLETGLLEENNTTTSSRMLESLNLAAGGRSLDILGDKELRRCVEEVMPPKGDAAT